MLGAGAVKEEFVAGGDTEVTGAGRGGETAEGIGVVSMVGVGSDPDQERDGESGGGPAVVGAHADQDTHQVTGRFVPGVQQANGLPGLLPVREVSPGKVVESGSLEGPGPDGLHDSPDVERASRERGQIRPVHQRPTHRERRIGPPVPHTTRFPRGVRRILPATAGKAR